MSLATTTVHNLLPTQQLMYRKGILSLDTFGSDFLIRVTLSHMVPQVGKKFTLSFDIIQMTPAGDLFKERRYKIKRGVRRIRI